MLKQEFEALAGYSVSDSDYYENIEPLYMATDLEKSAFVQTLNPQRFALPTERQALAKLRKVAKTYAMSGDIETFFTLQEIAQDFGADFYRVDRRNPSEWCYISEKYHQYSGRLESLSLSLGRLGGRSCVFVLWSAQQ